MKPNRFREAIAAGKVPVGHMVMEFGTRGVAKMLDSTGVDFVLFDMEHSGFEMDRIADLLAWSKACSFAPMVRVPQGLYHFLARVMDAGALGVMVGNVQSAEEAKSIVSAVKYAPMGRRGVGLGTAHTDYVIPNAVEYFAQVNASSVVICQIESPDGVGNSAAIAATEGVDVLWVGHFDLSTAMGIPGQFQDPDFLAALGAVVASAKASGKLLGIQPGNWDQAEQWIAMGFNVISCGSDIGVYRGALSSSVTKLRDRVARG